MGKITNIVHDLGIAVWWGGTLMGTFAMNPAVEVLDDPEERGKMIDEGWARFQPYAVAGFFAAGVSHFIMRRNPPKHPSDTYKTVARLKDGLFVIAAVANVASLAFGRIFDALRTRSLHADGNRDRAKRGNARTRRKSAKRTQRFLMGADSERHRRYRGGRDFGQRARTIAYALRPVKI